MSEKKPGRLGCIEVELTLMACHAHERELCVGRSQFLQLPDGGRNTGLAASEVFRMLEQGHHPEATLLHDWQVVMVLIAKWMKVLPVSAAFFIHSNFRCGIPQG